MILQSSKKPEEVAREDIDKMLELSGWEVQSLDELNQGAGLGVAAEIVENMESVLEQFSSIYHELEEGQ